MECDGFLCAKSQVDADCPEGGRLPLLRRGAHFEAGHRHPELLCIPLMAALKCTIASMNFQSIGTMASGVRSPALSMRRTAGAQTALPESLPPVGNSGGWGAVYEWEVAMSCSSGTGEGGGGQGHGGCGLLTHRSAPPLLVAPVNACGQNALYSRGHPPTNTNGGAHTPCRASWAGGSSLSNPWCCGGGNVVPL